MKLISPREAARRLKVPASTLYRVIDRDEVRQEPIRVDRLRVQGDEKSGDVLSTSPAFREKLLQTLAAVKKRRGPVQSKKSSLRR